MLRPSASARRVLGLALAVSVGTGIGVGAYSLGSATGANSSQLPRVATAPVGPAGSDVPGVPDVPDVPTTVPTPGTSAASALSLEEAHAIALQVAPGRVVEWDEDREPTGLRYDVKVLHDDGTTTDVEVDTVTGQVTSIDHDNDRD